MGEKEFKECLSLYNTKEDVEFGGDNCTEANFDMDANDFSDLPDSWWSKLFKEFRSLCSVRLLHVFIISCIASLSNHSLYFHYFRIARLPCNLQPRVVNIKISLLKQPTITTAVLFIFTKCSRVKMIYSSCLL